MKRIFFLNLLLFLTAGFFYSLELNGFKIVDPLIPADQIKSGGPPRDGIPSIDKPKFVPVSGADFMSMSDKVMGVNYNGEIRAYPVKILNWHEIVNDRFGNKSVVITYCPLCGSGVVFEAKINGENLRFGVSGLLYNSDVLLYDRKTGSLWSQLKESAVNGPMKGTKLKKIPAVYMTWEDWIDNYPDSWVLSVDTGFGRNYERNPYFGYESSPGIWFDVEHTSDKLFSKEPVYGIVLDNSAKAYPLSYLNKEERGFFSDTFKGRSIQIKRVAKDSYIFSDEKGSVIPAVQAFWFAWYTFYPDTDIYGE